MSSSATPYSSSQETDRPFRLKDYVCGEKRGTDLRSTQLSMTPSVGPWYSPSGSLKVFPTETILKLETW